MAEQGKSQKDKVERLMHEFKHGALEIKTGKKIRHLKEAIAIGVSKAGASDQQSLGANRRREREVKETERRGRTRGSLHTEAKRKNVASRSETNWGRAGESGQALAEAGW